MKMKKLGSLLTAVTMIASMAAYLPVTVSAEYAKPTVVESAPASPKSTVSNIPTLTAPEAKTYSVPGTVNAPDTPSNHSDWDSYVAYLEASNKQLGATEERAQWTAAKTTHETAVEAWKTGGLSGDMDTLDMPTIKYEAPASAVTRPDGDSNYGASDYADYIAYVIADSKAVGAQEERAQWTDGSTKPVDVYNTAVTAWNTTRSDWADYDAYQLYVNLEDVAAAQQVKTADGAVIDLKIKYLDNQGHEIALEGTPEEIAALKASANSKSGVLTLDYGETNTPTVMGGKGIIAQVADALKTKLGNAGITKEVVDELVDEIYLKGKSKNGPADKENWVDWDADTKVEYDCIFRTAEYEGTDVKAKIDELVEWSDGTQGSVYHVSIAEHDYVDSEDNLTHGCAVCGDIQNHDWETTAFVSAVDGVGIHKCADCYEAPEGEITGGALTEAQEESAKGIIRCSYKTVDGVHACSYSLADAEHPTVKTSYDEKHNEDMNYVTNKCDGEDSSGRPCTVTINDDFSSGYDSLLTAPKTGTFGTDGAYSLVFERAEKDSEGNDIPKDKTNLKIDEVKATLTLNPKTAGAEYNIPSFGSNTSILTEIADQNGLAVQKLNLMLKEVIINGKLKTIDDSSVTALTANSSGDVALDAKMLKVDCRAASAVHTKFSGTSAACYTKLHHMEANTASNNHKCTYSDFFDNSFEAHTFVVNKSTKSHVCACGAKDTDYKKLVEVSKKLYDSYKDVAETTGTDNVEAPGFDSTGKYKYKDTNGNGVTNPSYYVNGYQYLHNFTPANHQCEACTAYDEVYHAGSNLTYSTNETTHTVKCKTTGCGFTKTSEAHAKTYFDGKNPANADDVDFTVKKGADVKALGILKDTSDVNIDDSGDGTTNPYIYYAVVAGKAIPAKSHFCSVCGYVFTKNQHTYDCKVEAYKNNSGDFATKIVPATSNSEKVVCICGEVDPEHLKEGASGTKHVFSGYMGEHICICGETSTAHAYNFVFDGVGTNKINDRTGYKYVSGANAGQVCSCGDKKSAHSGHTSIVDVDDVVNTAQTDSEGAYTIAKYGVMYNQKHYCECGELLETSNDFDNSTPLAGGAKRDAHKLIADPVTHKHVCACGYVEESVKVHSFNRNKIGSGSTTTVTLGGTNYTTYSALTDDDTATGTGALCEECEAVNPSHKHEYTIYVNQKHYCACGAEETTHEYVNGQCRCGALQNHTHTFSSVNCKCTNPKCDYIEHDFVVITGEKAHICQRCGKTADEITAAAGSDLLKTEVGVEIYNGHIFAADTTKNNHVCACGMTVKEYNAIGGVTTIAANGHKYDENATGVNIHVCTECGYKNHNTNGTRTNSKGHICSCGYEWTAAENYGHDYSLATDRCTATYKSGSSTPACGELKPGHVCAFIKNAAGGETIPSGGTASAGDELCKCGEKVEHELVVCRVTSPANQVQYHECAHTVVSTIISNTTTSTSIASSDCNKTTATHSYDTSVKLDSKTTAKVCDCGVVKPDLFDAEIYNGKTYRNLVAGDLSANFSSSYVSDLMSKLAALRRYDILASGTSSAPTYKNSADDLKNILVAKTEAEKERFIKAYTDFQTALDDMDNNKAGSAIEVRPATGCGDMAVNSGATYIREKIGSTVKLAIQIKPGYKFVGWYKKADCSDTMVSDKIDYTVTMTEGTTTFYAKLEMEKTVYVKLSNGIKYFASISAPESSAAKTAKGDDIDIALNEHVKIAYRPTGDKTFLYFKDKLGGAHVGTKVTRTIASADGVTSTTDPYGFIDKNNFASDPGYSGGSVTLTYYTYEFDVSGREIYTAEVAEYVGKDVYVSFMNDSKDNATELRSAVVEKNDSNHINVTSKEPAVPARIGMDCDGWAMIDAPNTRIRTADINVGSANMIKLVPHFVAQSGLKITFANGVGSMYDEADAAKNAADGVGFTHGDRVAITAPSTSNGKFFSGWAKDGSVFTKERVTYYTIQGNDTLTAMYENTSASDDASYITLVGTTDTSTGKRVVNLASRWNILAKDRIDSSIVETGFIFSFTGVKDEGLSLDNVDGTSVRQKKVDSKDTNASASYPMTLASDSVKNATVTARAYVTYRDKNGVTKTEYSNMITAVKP